MASTHGIDRSGAASGTGAQFSGNFTQAGAGAVTRTEQDKLRETVSVKDFGAVGDGVTDDTAEIGAAIAAMPAVGGTLTLDGIFLISSTITVDKKIRVLMAGGRGPNSSDPPQSYFKMASSMTTVGLSLEAQGVILDGGGIVATAGCTGGGVQFKANGCMAKDFSAIGVSGSGVGIRVGQDADGGNQNSWVLQNCNASNWGSHGFLISDATSAAAADANAGTAMGCVALSNGGDGFKCEFAHLNTFVGCLGESNTGYGFNMADGFNNWIVGGDYETNTAGQVIFQALSRENGEMLGDAGVTVTDNGFRTRRLGQTAATQKAYTPCLIGSSGTDKTITANSVSGTICTSTSATHGYSNGDMIWIRSQSNENLNGAFVISNVTANTFDFTFRTDAQYTPPSSASGLSATARKSGVYTTAVGWYQRLAGRIHFNAQIVTSALTGITGTVQLLLPAATVTLTNSYGNSNLESYTGITHTNGLRIPIAQDGAIQKNFMDTIGSGATPAQLTVAGLAAATTVIVSGWYWI